MSGAIIILIISFAISEICASIPNLDHRIVGGKNASILDYPYQVSLRKSNGHICGGSIIHSLYLLTAAHCVHGGMVSTLSIRAGSKFVDKGGKIIKVCGITVHENYNLDTMNNDIAILKLCIPLAFSDKILPIALPETGEQVAQGTKAFVTGWGFEVEYGRLPSTLKQVEVPIVPHTDCNKLYSQYGGVTDNMICAGYLKLGGKDACQGDSGGPLRANGKLMGIVSWGFGCAKPNFPGVYTKVSNYRNWIRKITNY